MQTPHAHLLVVEDDPEMRDLLRKVLEKDGHLVTLAADGREALSSLGLRPFDLVITDLVMPAAGGFPLLESIRQLSPTTPVIIVTAFSEWGASCRAMALGASAFISKPLRMADLTGAVHAVLAERGAATAP
jgi:DNA-binding response OmpR family regulator